MKRTGIRYWLMKTEPSVCSIDDILASVQQTTQWDGVRNYQARNYIRDSMREGDQVIIYHSNALPSHIAGIGVVVGESSIDPTQFDPNHSAFDDKSTREDPRWYQIGVQATEKFTNMVSIGELRQLPSLSELELFRASRLSVQPLSKRHFDLLVSIGRGERKTR